MNNEDSEIKRNNNIILEKDTGHKPIPLHLITKYINSLCKIRKPSEVTGFFIKLNIRKEYFFLVTSCKVISQEYINTINELEIIVNENKYIIDLDKEERKIVYLNRKDITAIEILDDDELKNIINCFCCDLNYVDGYEQYKEKDIFTLYYPNLLSDIHADIGKISKINNYEFEYLLYKNERCSGTPIILVYNERLIGIYKEHNDNNNKIINIGTFIGELINKIKNWIEEEDEKKELELNIEENDNNINDESESNLFIYNLNGKNKVAKITDSIFIKPNDIIEYNVFEEYN